MLPTALVLAALVAVGADLVLGTSAPRQPIEFNHSVHTQDLEMDCVECHQHALAGQRATIPNLGVCADCHEEAETESPAEALLVDFIQRGEPIPWMLVTWMPSDVFFSHRRHAAVAEIPCATCHGEVAARQEPLSRPLVRLRMDDCIDCHDERGVTVDCVACHR